MLLLGLSLEPEWVESDGLTRGSLYYSPRADTLENEALCLRLKPETVAFFKERKAVNPESWGRLRWDGIDWFLPFGGNGGEPPDVIASAFFWLAGWQEHTTVERDRHGRFQHEASLQANLDVAFQPLVDVYRCWLGENLLERGASVRPRTWNGKSWAVALTHDIDFIETRKRSRSKSLALGKVGEALVGWGPGDPRRRSMQKIRAAEHVRRLTATYFFKAGASSAEDIGYALNTPWLQRFMADLEADGFEIGLHPSYAAYDNPQRLREELDRLHKAGRERPESARMHFLRWIDPTTPRMLDQAEFRIDSSLGFSEHEGFRRATCHPFRIFDLAANRPLNVWEMPLAVMDTTLFSHRGLSAEGAIGSIQSVFDAAKRVGGCAVMLWHNTPVDEANFPGRPNVFESAMDLALADGAFVGSLRDALGNV